MENMIKNPFEDLERKVVGVFGGQIGDEGKAKMVHLLSQLADIVGRLQGGPNAGHSMEWEGLEGKAILHQIPCGIVVPHTTCVIGNGVVLNADTLVDKEIKSLDEWGIKWKNRIIISKDVHLILPYHHLTEKGMEDLKGENKIGTTGRGIGSVYADKIERIGIRVGHIFESDFYDKLDFNIKYKVRLLREVFSISITEDELRKQCMDRINKLKELINNKLISVQHVAHWMNEEIEKGKKVLLEGAQGTLLDIDHGTYPFVTSSCSTVGGISGIGLSKIERVILVLKAYTTRVGNGPLITELFGEDGDKLRELGGEYGSTTDRPRRCGWFDAPIARFSRMLNGADWVVISKLDVLDQHEIIKICKDYNYNGSIMRNFPTNLRVLGEVQPNYITLNGWKTPITDIRSYSELPQMAKVYLDKLQEQIGLINIASVGPRPEQTIQIMQ